MSQRHTNYPKSPSQGELNADSPAGPPGGNALAAGGPTRVAAEVETTLPLLAASDQVRAALAGSRAARQRAGESGPALEYALPAVELDMRKQRGRWMVAALALGALITVGGIVAWLTMDRWWPFRESASAGDLQMQAEPQGKGLITIRWNPKSASVRQAHEGRLITTEPGQQPRTVTLDIEQLKAGHVYYQSQAESLAFRLEVVDRSGSVTRESEVTLSSTAPPGAPPPGFAPTAPGAPVAPSAQVTAARAPAQPSQPVGITPAQQASPSSRTALRQFTAPTASQPGTEPTQAVVLDAPATIPGAAVVGSSPIAVSGSVKDLGVPTVSAAAPPQTAPAKDARVGGDLRAAALIKKVNPVYPENLRQLHMQGTVRFSATIGKDGKLRDLHLVSGNPVLVQSATEAVKQWVYRPTMLNGEPVEVITRINVDFALGRQ